MHIGKCKRFLCIILGLSLFIFNAGCNSVSKSKIEEIKYSIEDIQSYLNMIEKSNESMLDYINQIEDNDMREEMEVQQWVIDDALLEINQIIEEIYWE